MMNLEQLIVEWKADAKMDRSEPGKELLRVPNLHAKYLEQFMAHSRALKEARFAYNVIRRLKSDYYSGRFTAEDYIKHGLPPFQFTLRNDLGSYLEADEDLYKATLKIAVHEEPIIFLTSVLKEINNRSFELKTYVEWLKFSEGGRG